MKDIRLSISADASVRQQLRLLGEQWDMDMSKAVCHMIKCATIGESPERHERVTARSLMARVVRLRAQVTELRCGAEEGKELLGEVMRLAGDVQRRC